MSELKANTTIMDIAKALILEKLHKNSATIGLSLYRSDDANNLSFESRRLVSSIGAHFRRVPVYTPLPVLDSFKRGVGPAASLFRFFLVVRKRSPRCFLFLRGAGPFAGASNRQSSGAFLQRTGDGSKLLGKPLTSIL